MDLSPAPLFTDVWPGPDDGAAYWLTTSDDVRIRVAAWAGDSPNGTVLMFPGRTEYVEKYGHTAKELAARGFACLSVDWRGQGLAQRLLDAPLVGHVEAFTDYQKDVAAMLRAAAALDLPKPYFLLAHSMGGCIGLRALMEDLPVDAAAFTGPMWGIRIAPQTRPFAMVLSHLMPVLGRGGDFPPSTTRKPYVLEEPFENNMLTTDRPMYDMMRDQLVAHPDLSLAGPSYIWLREALAECSLLAAMPAPSVPCLTFVGSQERIVDVPAIHKRMQDWPQGRLEIMDSAEHEVLMEGSGMRNVLFDAIATRFAPQD